MRALSDPVLLGAFICMLIAGNTTGLWPIFGIGALWIAVLPYVASGTA